MFEEQSLPQEILGSYLLTTRNRAVRNRIKNVKHIYIYDVAKRVNTRIHSGMIPQSLRLNFLNKSEVPVFWMVGVKSNCVFDLKFHKARCTGAFKELK